MGFLDALFRSGKSRVPDVEKLRAKRNVAGLIRALQCRENIPYSSDRTYQHEAMEVLGELRAGEAFDPILALLKGGNDTPTRRAAARALGSLGDPRAVPDLVAGLDDEQIRRVCVVSLGQLADGRAAEALVRLLRKACEKNDDLGAADLEQALTAIGDPAIPHLLAAIAEPATDDRMIFRGMQAIGLMKGASAVDALIAGLKDERGSVRQYAAMYLNNFDDQRAASPLIEALSSDSSLVFEARKALTSLARRHATVVESLKGALEHQDAAIQRNASGILLSVGKLTPLLAINAHRGVTPPAGPHQGPLFRVSMMVRETSWATKHGFIDRDGRMVIEPKFGYAGNFFEGRAAILVSETHRAYIDESGSIVIGPMRWLDTNDFSEGLALVSLPYSAGWEFIDRNGKVVISRKDLRGVSPRFREGRTSAMLGEQWGYMDVRGEFVITPRFAECTDFSDGLAAGKAGDYWQIIDERGTACGTIDAQDVRGPFSSGLFCFARGGKTGYADRTGKEVVAPRFDYSGTFSEGLAWVCVDRRFGYIDAHGHYVVQPVYDDALNFVDGRAFVKAGEDYRLIDRSGQFVVEQRFSSAKAFRDGLALVTRRDPEAEAYIDLEGREVWRWSSADSKATFGD